MKPDETARLMAQAVLLGDMVAARQLADWLADHVDDGPVPFDPGALVIHSRLSRRATKACLKAVTVGKVGFPLGRLSVKKVRAFFESVTLGEVLTLTAADLLERPGCGRKTLAEVRIFLGRHGLRLAGDLETPGATSHA